MKKLYYALMLALVACHQYDDPAPIQGALPKELNVDVSQVWVRLYPDGYGNLIPSIKIPFQYQGAEYELYFDNIVATLSNAMIQISTREIITAVPTEFTSIVWSQEDEVEGYFSWGNSFTMFEPYSLTIRSSVLANPGAKLKVPAMLGVERITVSVDPTTAIMIYSHVDSNFGSEAYSRLYLDNPQYLISNVHTVINAIIDYNHLDASIKKTEQ